MGYQDLREFLKKLDNSGQLKRIKASVDANLEITEILSRLIVEGGPAVIFEDVKGHDMPIVANLFGTVERVALGLGTDVNGLDEIGNFLADVARPKPPAGIVEALKALPHYKKLLSVNPKKVSAAACQEVILKEKEVDLNKLPILKCWPNDAGKLITWPLVITKGPDNEPFNVGIYRMQVLSKNTTVMRWLSHRGGAMHWHKWQKTGKPMPVAVAIGNEPAMIIAAATPIPDDLSEFDFAGLLRKKSVELVKCVTSDLMVPASSEIVLEGEIVPGDVAKEGPFADHTGFYNDEELHPVFHVKCITRRKDAYYLTTVTGRPPREDAILALALNRMVLPLLKQSFSEVVDFALPMEAVSYRIAVVSIEKQYPGQAKQLIMGLYGYLKQFLGLKYIIVVDSDVDVQNWGDVIWSLATRVDPARDTFIVDEAPIDTLDFAADRPGIGSKMGIDATSKAPPEVNNKWPDKVRMDPDIIAQVDKRLNELGLSDA